MADEKNKKQSEKGKRWSPEHIEYLKNHYAYKSAYEIGQEIGRSEIGVRRMVDKLKLAAINRQHFGGGYNRWTPEEERKLEKYIFKWPIKKLAKQLNRTVGAVKCKAAKKGLLRQIVWSRHEIQKLKFLLPRHSREEIAAMLERGVSAVVTKARRLGLTKRRSKRNQ